MGGFDTKALFYHFLSPLEDLLYLIWAFLLLCYSFTAQAVIISYLWCWCKDCQRLFCFRRSSKTGLAGKRQLFCIWRSSRKGRGDLSKVWKSWLITTVGSGDIRKLYLSPIHLMDLGSTQSTLIHLGMLLIYFQVLQLAPGLLKSKPKLASRFRSISKYLDQTWIFVWVLRLDLALLFSISKPA